jgi:glutathione S-transferase
MRYELYYWPSIQGRGEFVRLALEEAGADYIDVVREDMRAAMRMMEDWTLPRPSFAPPFVKAGELIIGQTANILLYLGDHHGLAPRSETQRLWTHQLQLTIADLVAEAHDTHHPLSGNLYYEDQKPAARQRAADFTQHRIPKYLSYFEQVIDNNLGRSGQNSGYTIGSRLTYVDLSLFQVMEGLRYAFPRAMQRIEPTLQHLVALHERVATRPRIAAYLASERRLPFNEEGIFRRYPELEDPAHSGK